MDRKARIVIGQIVFWLYIAAVLYLCFGKFDDLSSVPRSIWGIPTDKVVHFCMFFPFPILAFFAFDPFTDTVRQSLLSCGLTFVIGVLVAAGTEFGQSFLPYRSGDHRDLVADCTALLISTVIVFVIDTIKQRKHA